MQVGASSVYHGHIPNLFLFIRILLFCKDFLAYKSNDVNDVYFLYETQISVLYIKYTFKKCIYCLSIFSFV